MADATEAVTEGTTKLQLDEVTGEMVSKGELKKRQKKREKARTVAKAKEAAAASGSGAKKPAPKPKEKIEETVIDPDYMFKVGFLDDVWKIRPEQPRTRFPPEPNGFLHIGHAKAIAINFGFAKYHGGECVLRYDDTNPEAEEEKYFDSILETIHWLGFKPARITYSSDNFDKLYADAEKLINLGKAYVCSCDDADIKLQRGGETRGERFRCKHAEKSTEENLQEFRDMRDGKYKPRERFLRFFGDITNGNPQMWDLAAYRVLSKHHFRTGDKWKIYPTYDMAHSLCDAYEGVTHSMCTTEFIMSRESYEWLNSTVGFAPYPAGEAHNPIQREFGRLAIAGTLLSKRKILKLIEDGIVRDWDDPRLFTLKGQRRRGIPPGAILSFVNELGVTTSASIISSTRYEQSIRTYLEKTVPRLMMVLDPLRVVIEDADDLDGTELTIPFSPKDPKFGTRQVKFTKTIFIDRSDFKEEADPSFFRLVPGQTVGLLHVPHPIKAVSSSRDEAGNVKEVRAVFDKEGKKPKAYIQWVPTEEAGSRRIEVRVHTRLFKSDNPNAAEGGFLNDINSNTETIYPEALIESGFNEVKRRAPWPEAAGESELGKGGPESVRFQALRIAYFAMDLDSTDEKIVLNRIVPLKEDAGKG